MAKKGTEYGIYGNSLNQSWRMITRKGVIYIPDILFVIVTFALTSTFLSLNGLLGPLLDVNRNEVLRSTIQSISQSTPALAKLILSFLILAVINVAVGINFLSTRFILVRNYLKGEKLNFKKAYKESYSYFWTIFSIKLTLFLFYIVPFILLILITKANTALLPVLLTLFILLWISIRVLFFFIYPEVFFKTKNYKALWKTARYSRKFLKHTILTLLLITLISFFINIIISFIPQFWFRIALEANLLASTSFVIGLFFVVRTLINIAFRVFQSGFIFSAFYMKKN